jgi:RNA polymerase sigma factor
MKELTKVIDVHPKTVERNREFIICLCIIYDSDYVNLKSYLNKHFNKTTYYRHIQYK